VRQFLPLFSSEKTSTHNIYLNRLPYTSVLVLMTRKYIGFWV